MYLGYFVQSIDPWIASGQSFLEMCPGTHVLVTGPVRFYTRLAKKLYRFQYRLPFSCSTFYGLTFSIPRPSHTPIAFFCVLPAAQSSQPGKGFSRSASVLHLVSFRLSRMRLRSFLVFNLLVSQHSSEHFPIVLLAVFFLK